MIVVIADDLTGAAEIGAVGLRYGLSAEVQTAFAPESNADLIVIDTDTRSMSGMEAAAEVERVVEQVLQHRPELLFKKVDSVLRGPVMAELIALLRATGAPRLLLVPANPSLGRVIRDGNYYVDDVPIHLTDFAHDPEYPATSSDVIEMLGVNASDQVVVQSLQEYIANAGIVVGEAASEQDLAGWASQIDASTVTSGAAGFFRSVLESRGYRDRGRPADTPPINACNTLFVCGSNSEPGLLRIVDAEAKGIGVARMPAALLEQNVCPDAFIDRWATEAKNALAASGRAMLAIGHDRCTTSGFPRILSRYLIRATEAVLGSVRVDLICIEGGSTASVLTRHMRWCRMTVQAEHMPGVVEMSIVGQRSPKIITKPGSYAWNMAV